MRTKAVCPGIRIRTVPAVSEAEMQAVLALEALEQAVSAPEAEKDGRFSWRIQPRLFQRIRFQKRILWKDARVWKSLYRGKG